MIAVDTNILVHAHRQELSGHERALEWLRRLAEGPEPWGIPVFCLGEFVRVVTHRRLFNPPSSLGEAIGALEGLLESSSIQVLIPGDRFPELFHTCLREADARGNLAFDAQIAALCRERGVDRILTMDRDFQRFPGLQILGPDAPPP
jgi:toxin-antitoxin system PIN domain toxin